MCSSMWREFGLAGDRRSDASHVDFTTILALEKSRPGAGGGAGIK